MLGSEFFGSKTVDVGELKSCNCIIVNRYDSLLDDLENKEYTSDFLEEINLSFDSSGLTSVNPPL